MNQEKYFTYSWRYTKDDLKFCPRCASRFSLEDIHIANQPQLVCDSCKFIFYLDPKLVVCSLVVNKGRILLLRRNEEPRVGKWGLPGGHVQRGDDLYDSAVRETHEEAGVNIIIKKILKLFSIPEHGIVQIVFLAISTDDQIVTNIESIEGKWFGTAEIPWDELAFETTTESIREFLNSPSSSGEPTSPIA